VVCYKVNFAFTFTLSRHIQHYVNYSLTYVNMPLVIVAKTKSRVHERRAQVDRANVDGTVTRNIWGSSVRNLFHVIVLAPRFFKWLLIFRKILAPLDPSLIIVFRI